MVTARRIKEVDNGGDEGDDEDDKDDDDDNESIMLMVEALGNSCGLIQLVGHGFKIPMKDDVGNDG